MSIFKSPQAKAGLVAWHHRFRERIGRPVESREVVTTLGSTHVLSCGRVGAPPVVLIHGALASSAHALSVVPELADHFRVHAVDVPGQSPLSVEVRPDVSGNTLGVWASEVFEALELSSAAVVGVSWGGFIACRLAVVAPEKIDALSLIVPAGLVSGFGWEPIVKVALPMALYRMSPSRKRFEKFAASQLTTRDALWVDYLEAAIRDFKMDFRAPRNLKDGELKDFKAPVQVIAAEKDLMFPGSRLLARAGQVFPNLAETELLAGARHSPSTASEDAHNLAESIRKFLEPRMRSHSPLSDSKVEVADR